MADIKDVVEAERKVIESCEYAKSDSTVAICQAILAVGMRIEVALRDLSRKL